MVGDGRLAHPEVRADVGDAHLSLLDEDQDAQPIPVAQGLEGHAAAIARAHELHPIDECL
jgi:hypothetical protein